MTEEKARALLRCGDRDGTEAWLADQPWKPRPSRDGWKVVGQRDGWAFTVKPLLEGELVYARAPGQHARPATWLVAPPPGRRA